MAIPGPRHWAPLLLAGLLLAACGGGGSGGTGSVDSAPAFTVSPGSFEVSVTPADPQPQGQLTVTLLRELPTTQWIIFRSSNRGLIALSHQQQGNAVTFVFAYRPPLEVADGRYEDDIRISVCNDQDCTQHAPGSPVVVRSVYTVTSPGAVATTTTSVAATATMADSAGAVASVGLDVTGLPEDSVWLRAISTTGKVAQVSAPQTFEQSASVDLEFERPDRIGFGTFHGEVLIDVCYDQSCTRHLQGSPIRVATTYDVDLVETGFDVLPLSGRVELGHDVVDAEFDAATNAVIMVSRLPANALHIYRPETGATFAVALPGTPTSLTLTTDGAHAAIGFETGVGRVSLADVVAGGTAVDFVATTTPVGDVAFDATGRVHVMSLLPAVERLRSVDFGTVVETVGTESVSGPVRGRRRPGTATLYVATGAPVRYDISTAIATATVTPPYTGSNDTCGDAWFDEAGTLLFTRCGVTFGLDDVPADDLEVVGTLERTDGPFGGFRFGSVSSSAARNEIASVETDAFHCGPGGDVHYCHSHVRFYDRVTLATTARFVVPLLRIDGDLTGHVAPFLFHSTDGSKRYLISRLNRGDPDERAWYFWIVP